MLCRTVRASNFGSAPNFNLGSGEDTNLIGVISRDSAKSSRFISSSAFGKPRSPLHSANRATNSLLGEINFGGNRVSWLRES